MAYQTLRLDKAKPIFLSIDVASNTSSNSSCQGQNNTLIYILQAFLLVSRWCYQQSKDWKYKKNWHKAVAFLDLVRGITTTNNGRNTQLTRNDCCMASSTTTVGDDGTSLLPLAGRLDAEKDLIQVDQTWTKNLAVTVILKPWKKKWSSSNYQFFHILHLKIHEKYMGSVQTLQVS